MPPIFPGRCTARTTEPFVVFLIGLRINRYFAFRKWIATGSAMGPMLKALFADPAKGFLGGETYFNLRGVMMIQYWRSVEDLERFALAPSEPHLKAWKRFNQSVGNDGSVGIWHEVYEASPGHYKAVYVNMPAFGLAAATRHAPMGKKNAAPQRPEPQSGMPEPGE